MHFLQRFILSFLAVLMFTTTTCFAVDVHFCKDEVQSIALFAKAKPCENMQPENDDDLPDCCKKKLEERKREMRDIAHFSKKPCCHNETVAQKSDVNQEVVSGFMVLSQLDQFTLSNFKYEFVIFDICQESNVLFRGPPDPDVIPDITIEQQVLII
jgi:hypothetical protein